MDRRRTQGNEPGEMSLNAFRLTSPQRCRMHSGSQARFALLKTVDLGDKRRNHRLGKILEDLTAQPEASVPQASRDNASMQGTDEFWVNVRMFP